MLDFAPSPQVHRFAFEPHDKVTIRGIAFRLIDTTDTGYVFVRLDGQGLAESFGRAEMSRLVDLGEVRHERGALLPESARARLIAPRELLSTIPDAQHRRARRKEAAVSAFLELEAAGHVNRTDDAIKSAKSQIAIRAGELLRGETQYDERKAEAGELVVPKFSARTLRRWLAAYEDLGMAGLFDRMGTQGNSERRLCMRSLMLLADGVRGFMTRQKPSQSAIYMDVKRLFTAENAERRAEGRPELVTPSKETVRQAILSLDPFHCEVARCGIDAARKKFAPIGTGIVLTRPLQRVEMDTWQVDLISLLTDSGLLHFLSDEEKESLGLNGKKKRWHLTVAQCATTRCILAMRLSRNPNAQATIQTIDMITLDKGIWSDAVGALTPWHMRGTPSYIYTDCGSEYVSYDVKIAARDIGISLEHAPAGHPEMRARIERFFRTMSINLMERLTGRTFSNMIERGDYDSKARAALTVDELCTVLVRWVVDIYHRRPHEGLDGESPGACWDRLVARYGVPSAADLPRRRLAFGTRMNRPIAEDGITILGVRYHTEALVRKTLRSRDRRVNLRWYSEDLGAIAVEIEGEWIEVRSVMRRFDGVRAQTHLAAVRSLRNRFKHEAELQESVVFQAIADIEAINGNAMRRVGLLVDDWSDERLRREEDRLFIGFGIEPDRQATAPRGTSDVIGDDLPICGTWVHEAGSEKYHKILRVASASTSTDGNSGQPGHSHDWSEDPDEPDFKIEDK